MHPFIPLFKDAAASLPSQLIMHPSFHPSFHSPFHLTPHLLYISPSLHLYLTLSLLLSSFIYIRFFSPFRSACPGTKRKKLVWEIWWCCFTAQQYDMADVGRKIIFLFFQTQGQRVFLLLKKLQTAAKLQTL